VVARRRLGGAGGRFGGGLGGAHCFRASSGDRPVALANPWQHRTAAAAAGDLSASCTVT